jgi:hypothetical protein
MSWVASRISEEVSALLEQPSAPSTTLLVLGLAALLLATLVAACVNSADVGAGNRPSCAQRAFGCWVRAGRIRNLLCAPCDRARGRYPVANTCQIPFFRDISDIYTFVFGYKTEGLFVEIGAYDGESFSNTSCLADVGWEGHYVEPVPRYADVCASRHAGNARVTVHRACVGETDGEDVNISMAGPFSSAVADEIASVSGSKLGGMLQALGWGHEGETTTTIDDATATATAGKAGKGKAGKGKAAAAEADGASAADASSSSSSSSSSSVSSARKRGGAARRPSTASREPAERPTLPPAPVVIGKGASARVSARSVSLNTFLAATGIPAAGAIDVMVVDTEGYEWPILRAFDIARFRPKLVIVEIQELQARYADNARAQSDASSMYSFFTSNGYSILYKDVVNTVFIHSGVRCVGGD